MGDTGTETDHGTIVRPEDVPGHEAPAEPGKQDIPDAAPVAEPVPA